jgi:selenocysteine lyase/cysteine desulfurase
MAVDPVPAALGHRAALRLVGERVPVPCVDARTRRYVDLDHAASTAVLEPVYEAVAEFLPWTSSVHRGAGFKSRVATAAFDGAREAVAEFAGARGDDVVVLVRNTTEALNVVAAALPPATRILASPVEHHANMLPWRDHDVQLLPFTRSPAELLEATEASLLAAGGRIELVAVTGASNVTGEVWPVAELADLAHRHGAELLADAAQLAPHRRLDVRGWDVDYLAFSGHKLYAPFGAGALVARPSRLRTGEPLLRGGGAIKVVTLDDVVWADPPDRYEAGSPNVVGAVALGAACEALRAYGLERLAARERALGERLAAGLAAVPGLGLLRLWPEGSCDRVGVATFTLDGFADGLVAAILSAEHGIGVRSGCFCAHPLMTHLLGISEEEAAAVRAEVAAGDSRRLPGAVRASIGLGTDEEDVDALVDALHAIVATGPRWRYAYDAETHEWRPDPDPRAWPDLPVRLAGAKHGVVTPVDRARRPRRR